MHFPANQMFAGNCTDQVEFYSSPEDYNYKRAVTWSVVMAWLIHVHPEFSTVFGLEAINEPDQNYANTPNLEQCKSAFLLPQIAIGVLVFRPADTKYGSLWEHSIVEKSFVLAVRSLELSLGIICDISFVLEAVTDDITLSSLRDALPIITKLAVKYELDAATYGGLGIVVERLENANGLAGLDMKELISGGLASDVSSRRCISTT